jgi:hypothetical protein
MKFKAGDRVVYKDDSQGIYEVIKIAEEGEVVKGPWYTGAKEVNIRYKCYVLKSESEEWELFSADRDDLEDDLELKTDNLKRQIKELEDELKEELTLKTFKFKVGDVIADSWGEAFKIVKLAEKGEVVPGPWSSGSKELTIPLTAYIFENNYKVWSYHPQSDEESLRLLPKNEMEKLSKVRIEEFEKELLEKVHKLKTLYENEDYYGILYREVQK